MQIPHLFLITLKSPQVKVVLSFWHAAKSTYSRSNPLISALNNRGSRKISLSNNFINIFCVYVCERRKQNEKKLKDVWKRENRMYTFDFKAHKMKFLLHAAVENRKLKEMLNLFIKISYYKQKVLKYSTYDTLTVFFPACWLFLNF